MSKDPLLELEPSSLEIYETSHGYEFVIDIPGQEHNLVTVEEPGDMVFEQLIEMGIIQYDR